MSVPRGRGGTLAAALCLAILAGCQSTAPPQPEREPYRAEVVRVESAADIEAIAPRLAETRVVFVGEAHRRYDHHLNQLIVIDRLYRRHPDLALGVEFFQWPFQSYLDAYIAGRLDEAAFLEKTEYFERWRFDYRHYRPILLYAQAHGIPVVALRVPEEMTAKVATQGLDALDAAERESIGAPVDRSDTAYRERLEDTYAFHPRRSGAGFERFYETQLLWDEGMAHRAADYLREHPGRRMVVLTGAGHVAYGGGIPERLGRRLPLDWTIVLNATSGYTDLRAADFLLLSEARSLPPVPRMGAQLVQDGPAVTVRKVTGGGPAAQAGLAPGDRLVAAAGEPVRWPTDVWLRMLQRRPGETLRLEVLRPDAGGERRLNFEVVLQ